MRTTLLCFALMGSLAASTAIYAETASSPLVVGENLKLGMPMAETFKLLGLPEAFTIKRGTAIQSDSVSATYAHHGVVIHFLNGGNVLEGLEILTNFTGKFASGIKLGASFNDLIGKYGVPASLTANIARYPEIGLYFVLDKDHLVSAKAFSKNSKLTGNRQLNME